LNLKGNLFNIIVHSIHTGIGDDAKLCYPKILSGRLEGDGAVMIWLSR